MGRKESNTTEWLNWWSGQWVFKSYLGHSNSSTLAWKIPWTEEPGGLQSMRLLGVRHDRATSLWIFTFKHWRRKWQPTPMFLPGESQGWGSLVGCHLWGHTESGTTEATEQQQQQQVILIHSFLWEALVCAKLRTDTKLRQRKEEKSIKWESGWWYPQEQYQVFKLLQDCILMLHS